MQQGHRTESNIAHLQLQLVQSCLVVFTRCLEQQHFILRQFSLFMR